MTYQLINVTSETDRHDYHAIREQVLWKARGRSGYDSKRPEEHDAANHPLLLKLDGRSIGTLRLDNFLSGKGIVRMVSIIEDVQRQGHGRKLSELSETYARNLDITTLFVNAAPEAIPYYEKLKWEPYTWDATELQGIAADCIQMRKFLMHVQSD